MSHTTSIQIRLPYGADRRIVTTGLPPADQARLLDRAADFELQHGHHGIAERLAGQAAELRAGVA